MFNQYLFCLYLHKNYSIANFYTNLKHKSMTFKAHYQAIKGIKNKRHFRQRIIEACKIQPASFYTWLRRNTVPALEQSIISELLGIPQNELFPNQ